MLSISLLVDEIGICEMDVGSQTKISLYISELVFPFRSLKASLQQRQVEHLHGMI